jgi:hypothetical protein
MLTPIVSIYILAILFVLLKLTLKHKSKYELVNEVGVPEELLKYIHSAVKLWGLKGIVTIIKYKKKKGEVIVTDGNLNFTIGGLNEVREDILG